MTFSLIHFEYVAPPLPRVALRCQAVYDLGGVIALHYPVAGCDQSMTLRLAECQLDLEPTEGQTVAQWLFSAYCDLPSVDRVLWLAGMGDAVPRPSGEPIAKTAVACSRLDELTISVGSHAAIDLATGLFWFIRDRVVVLTASAPARMIAGGSELVQ